jgi:hypothetical protein
MSGSMPNTAPDFWPASRMSSPAGSVASGLVARADTRDPRRICYKLTAAGKAVLKAESERLERLAAKGRCLRTRARGIAVAAVAAWHSDELQFSAIWPLCRP